MLPADTYAYTENHGVPQCVAKMASAQAMYGQLSQRVKPLIAHLKAAGVELPVQEITIGQTIGASMVVAVQGIVGLLSLVVPLPPSLQALFDPSAPPAKLVLVVGSHADEILAYINAALTAKPDAINAAIQQARTPPPPPIEGAGSQAMKALFTKDRMIALGVGVVTIGGLIALAHSASKRAGGRVDRSGMFHDPNAVYDDDDGDDDESEPEPDVIDVESVEVRPQLPAETEPAA